ncbi:hypothetical protein BS78_K270200 [Paspalum vaginatum]|uniref:Uncharacterized protein n=1 Tax=Paspalum vaginatum TaxID=158149 RepID=A0A9W7X8G3_9POAL|nr:hypothetical protein BS78_K270200 [Paspalum vaginatum]
MKRGISFNGIETFMFGSENNNLRIFPPNSYKFRPKNHIILDEVQESLLDNFWDQYNYKREEKGYILSILNSLPEYFHIMNSKMSSTEDLEYIKKRTSYVIFEGKMPGIYISFEEVVAQKRDEIDEAMNQARKILGTNYFMEPRTKEYIQKFRKAKGNKIPEISYGIKEERILNKGTYKDCLTKGIDPINRQYIEIKIEEKFEIMSPEWKKSLKEKITIELTKKLHDKFEEMKRFYDKNGYNIW